MNLAYGLELLLRGISIGCIYGLVAVGYNIVYSTVNVFNIAHGDLLMAAAMLAFLLHVGLGLPLAAVALLIILAVIMISLIEERIAVRPLLKQGHGHFGWIISTLGFSIVLTSLAEIFGGTQTNAFPKIFSDMPVKIFGITVVPEYIFFIFLALVLTSLLEVFYRKTIWGKAMVATAQDQDAASLRGIDVKKIAMLAFAFAAVIVAITGFFLVPIVFASASVGKLMSMKGFIALAIGGIGNNIGAMIGGIVIAVVEIISIQFIHAGYQDSISFIVLLVTLLIIPKGLFGQADERQV